MKIDQLERLLNTACEIIIELEADLAGLLSDEDKVRIEALFQEIKYSDELDSEMSYTEEDSIVNGDTEAQDWDKFKEGKI